MLGQAVFLEPHPPGTNGAWPTPLSPYDTYEIDRPQYVCLVYSGTVMAEMSEKSFPSRSVSSVAFGCLAAEENMRVTFAETFQDWILSSDRETHFAREQSFRFYSPLRRFGI